MKKQKFIWSIVLGSAMFLGSCSNDDSATDVDQPVNANASVTISLITPGATRGSSGTEAPLTGEGVNSFEAYTFDGTGTVVDYVRKTGATTASLKAAEGSGNAIVVIANADPAIGDSYTLSGLKALVGTFKFTKTNSTVIPATGLVMSGIEEGLTFNEGSNTASVTVKRLVSKFNNPTVDPSVSGFMSIPDAELVKIFGAGATCANTSFTYVARALANGAEQSYIFKNTWVRPLPFAYLNSDFATDGSYPADGVYCGFLANDVTTPVYVHENYPFPDLTVDGVTGYNPLEVYCFIIKGTLTNADGALSTGPLTRYWRVNLVKTTTVNGNDENENYAVHRNGIYKVTVNSLKTIGHETPEDAEKETPVIPLVGDTSVDVTVNIVGWDIYDSVTQM